MDPCLILSDRSFHNTITSLLLKSGSLWSLDFSPTTAWSRLYTIKLVQSLLKIKAYLDGLACERPEFCLQFVVIHALIFWYPLMQLSRTSLAELYSRIYGHYENYFQGFCQLLHQYTDTLLRLSVVSLIECWILPKVSAEFSVAIFRENLWWLDEILEA